MRTGSAEGEAGFVSPRASVEGVPTPAVPTFYLSPEPQISSKGQRQTPFPSLPQEEVLTVYLCLLSGTL